MLLEMGLPVLRATATCQGSDTPILEYDAMKAMEQQHTTTPVEGDPMNEEARGEVKANTSSDYERPTVQEDERNQEVAVAQPDVQHTQEDITQFLSACTTEVRRPVLHTPAPKVTQQQQGEEQDNTLRRSGRIATKQKINGKKKPEQLAQDVLAKKLGLSDEALEKENEARNRIMNLFENPLPQEAIQAMEDLLQAMNIDKNRSTTKVAVKAGPRKTK